MKSFLVLLLVGCVSASLKEDFEKASSEAVKAFKRGLENAPPLHQAPGVDSTEELQRFERGAKEDLEKYIKEAFDKTLDKIVQAIKDGKNANPEAVLSLLALEDKMKGFDIMDHELEGLKEQIDDHVKKILEKMGIFEASYSDVDPLHSTLEDLSFRNFFIRMKGMSEVDNGAVAEDLQGRLQNYIQDVNDLMMNLQNKLMDFQNWVQSSVMQSLDQESEVDKGKVAEDLQGKLQNYTQDVNEIMMHLQSKLMDFQNWVQTSVIQSLESEVDKRAVAENLQGRLQDYIHDVHEIMNRLQNQLMRVHSWMQTSVIQSLFKEGEVDKRAVAENLQGRLQDYIQDVHEIMNHLQSKLMRFHDWVQNSVIQSLDQSEVDNKGAVAEDLQGRLQDYMQDVNDIMMHLQSKLIRVQNWVQTSVIQSLESEVDSKGAVSEDLQGRLQDYTQDVNEIMMNLQSKLMRFQNWVQTSVIQSLASEVDKRAVAEDLQGRLQDYVHDVHEIMNLLQNKLMRFHEWVQNSVIQSLDKESEVDKRAVADNLQGRLQDYIQDVHEIMNLLQSKLMRFHNWMQNSVVQSLAQV